MDARVDGGVTPVMRACLAVLLAGGCAPSLKSVQEQHAGAASCCATLAELGYEPLAGTAERAFELGEGSRAFDFETGKSFYRAFELPAGGPHPLRLSSYVIGDDPSGFFVFFPVVLVLDAGFHPVRTVGPQGFHWEKASFEETSGWRHKLEASFQAGGPGERYLVVHTTNALLQQATSVEMLDSAFVIIAGVPALIPVGTKSVRVPNGPAGFLRLRVGVPVKEEAPFAQ